MRASCWRVVLWSSVLAAAAASGTAQEPGYSGSEMCNACHDEIGRNFRGDAHIFLERDAARGWKDRACESCHGPGARHSETLEPGDIDAGTADKTCLSCHLNQPTSAGRIQGGHARNQVGCVACHSIHAPPPAVSARRNARLNQQCAGCHASAWTSFQRPHAHRLREGAMSCVDCHNPHGGFLSTAVRAVAANEPGCLRCHSDKRGPFVFEHAPVRLEGCQSCHEPHGSSNPRMLTRHEVLNQCLECHANIARPQGGSLGGIPTAFHDLRSARFRNCTLCHVRIHGSNVNRAFLR